MSTTNKDVSVPPGALNDPKTDTDEFLQGPPGTTPGVDPGDLFTRDQHIFKTPEEDDSPPEGVIEAFAEHGLDQRKYQCVLKNAKSQNILIKTFTNCYPSTEWIINHIGPGEYKLVFLWRNKNASSKAKSYSETIFVHIDENEETMRQYRQFQYQQKIEDYKKNRKLKKDALLEKQLDADFDELDEDKKPNAPQKDPMQIAREQISQSMELVRAMGIGQASQAPPSQSPIQWDKIIVALPAVIQMFTQAQERQQTQMQQMMSLMISMSNNNNSQLVELVKAQNGPTKGKDMMVEFMDMIRGALDVKELFKDKEESLSDKLIRLVEGVAPHIASIAAMPRAQQNIDPRVMLARNVVDSSPDFQALQRDPEEMVKFVSNLDETFGWEQADVILDVMTGGKIQRPEQCPRQPDKRYKRGDPRNTKNNVGTYPDTSYDDTTVPDGNE